MKMISKRFAITPHTHLEVLGKYIFFNIEQMSEFIKYTYHIVESASFISSMHLYDFIHM